MRLNPRRTRVAAAATFVVAAAFGAAIPTLRAADTLDAQNSAALNGGIVPNQESEPARNREAAHARSRVPPEAVAFALPNVDLAHLPSPPPAAHSAPSPFGYLEFDWSSGVPGFGLWPEHPTAPGH